MTIDPGAKQKLKPWTTFTDPQDIPDWIANAYMSAFGRLRLDIKHEHVEIEQTWVISGAIVDDEGEVRAGDYVWRPAGNRHLARSPEGALVLSFFLKPNRFLEGPSAGKNLE